MKIQNAFRLGLFGGLGVLVAVVIGSGLGDLGHHPHLRRRRAVPGARHRPGRLVPAAAPLPAVGGDPHRAGRHPRGVRRPGARRHPGDHRPGQQPDRAACPTSSTRSPTTTPSQKWWNHNLPWLPYRRRRRPTSRTSSTKNIGDDHRRRLQTVFTIASGVFGVVIVLILTLYFVASLSSIKRGLYQLVPATKREKFIDIAEQISKSVGRYVLGQVALGLSNGILSFLFLTSWLILRHQRSSTTRCSPSSRSCSRWCRSSARSPGRSSSALGVLAVQRLAGGARRRSSTTWSTCRSRPT